MHAFELDNYVAGHRFSDESNIFYNSEDNSFRDLAGFSALGQDLKNRVGTQVFETVGANDRKGLVFDGTNHLEMTNPVCWGGSVVMVFKFDFIGSGTTTTYLNMDGFNSIATNNSRLAMTQFSGNHRFEWRTFSNLPNKFIEVSTNNSDLVVVVATLSQESGTSKYTINGVDIEESPVVSNGQQNGFSLSPTRSDKMVLGMLSGVQGDTSLNADYKITMLEHHFFKDDIIANQLDKTKLFIEHLNDYYA